MTYPPTCVCPPPIEKETKMTANELADWIKDTEFYDNPNPEINDKMDEVEAMLRQQQAELDRAVELYTDKAIENEALRMMLANRNDALDKLELK